MEPARILIVEDDAILTVHLEATLVQMGYSVVGMAATGEAAVATALAQKPDAVLMDIRLRGEMTGIQAAEIIHQRADIPVIYLTAYADESLLQQAKVTEAYAYLAKPVRDRELRASLEMALYKHQAEQHIQHLNQVLRAVRDVNHLITHERDPRRLLEAACQVLLRTRDYRFVWIGDPAGDHLIPLASAGEGKELMRRVFATVGSEHPGHLPGEDAFWSQRAVICHDMLHDDRYAAWREEVEKHNFRSMAAIPMSSDQTRIGALCVCADRTDLFDDEEVDLLAALASDLALGLRAIKEETARKQAEETLARVSHQNEMILKSAGEGIIGLDPQGNHTFVNPAAAAMLGYQVEELIGRNSHSTLHHTRSDGRPYPHEECPIYTALQDGQVHREVDEEFWRKDGTSFPVEYVSTPIVEQGKIVGAVVTFVDITERQRAERALQESETKFRNIVENASEGIILADEKGVIIEYNPATEQMTGLERKSMMGETAWDFQYRLVLDERKSPAVYERIKARWLEAIATGYSSMLNRPIEAVFRKPNGRKRIVAQVLFPIPTGKGFRIGGIARDITERKQREQELEAIASISAALRVAETRAQMFPIILDQLLELLQVKGATIALRDLATDEIVIELGRGSWTNHTGLRLAPREGIVGHVIETGKLHATTDLKGDVRAARPELVGALNCAVCVPLSSPGETIGALFIGSDSPIDEAQVHLLTSIADMAANAIHRAALHERTEQQVRELSALATVDRAISASLDLNVTLGILLDQIMSQLRVDAAAVHLLKPATQTLDYAAGRGLRTGAMKSTRLRMGEGLAGRAAMDRQTLVIKDCRLERPDLARDKAWMSIFQAEEIVTLIAVPLISKGLTKGVLEVFHRSPLHPDPEWLGFLESLADQAAIAVDNAELFDGLERANLELVMAYDSTIEGWSRALDLRDKETEGHSSRVTDLTLQLARALNVPEADLVHVRRGALLHDIGKMGIPDEILLKPGALTAEEWEIMRRHPVYAFELLSPIPYLRKALEIPYCHHEKWDGSGYPRGLKGDQIPLVARIFAVVDVWDALRSDRPYRPAWPREKAYEHIRAQTGKHFDPEIVQAFLAIAQTQRP